MDDLLHEFVAETRETLEAIAGELVAWEADPSDRSRLDAIFRFVHTVKGSCGFLDLPRLARLSHAAEDGLQAVRDGRREPDRAFVDATLAIVDRIGALTEAIAEGRALDDGADDGLIASLEGRAEPVDAPIAAERRSAARSVRLRIDLLDRMMGRMSDLVLVRNELARKLRDAGATPEVESALERFSATVADLRDSVTRMRMQRIDSLFATLPRLARDTAAELGKSVTLTIEGGDVELDREMIEMIRDPIAHIVRNAVDHGIEAPVERARLGKRENGRIRVGARQIGNQIEIRVSDDGRGIDGAALAARLVGNRTLSADEAARMTDAQKRALVLRPGVSTADAVSALSGRGVGLDVVHNNVEQIGGTVTLEGTAGQGLDVVMRVPLTLSIIAAVTLVAGGQRFALPRAAIDEIVATGPTVTPGRIGDAGMLHVRDRMMPHIALAETLEIAGGEPAIHVLVTTSAGAYALGVDALGDAEELVIKPAAPMIMAHGGFAGETLPDNGVPMLVLDAAGIAARAGIAFARPVAQEAALPEAPPTMARLLLYRALDGSWNAVSVAVLDQVLPLEPGAIVEAGGMIHVRIGDELLPLAGPRPDGARSCQLLRLTDGERAIGVAIDAASDIVEIPEAAVRARPAPGVTGVALVGDVAVTIIDAHALFAAVTPLPRARGALALVADGEGWMETMLKPLLEGAGYAICMVADDADGGRLTIALDRDAPISLRREVGPRCPDDRSVYRYDRAALFAAIERADAAA